MTTHLSRRTLLGLAPALLTGMAACTKDTEPGMRLTVVTSDWNGWDRDHTPTPVTQEIEPQRGTQLHIPIGGESLTMIIIGVSRSAVRVTTSSPMAPRTAKGGLNLNDLKSTFTVNLDQATEFSTASMDSGHHFVLTLSRR
ncbi:hypothetical protein ACQBAR_15155 [Propionibacteriaceae bacterium Y1685]|uniref:hypothetical protein n=1 Tax=Microlunatus sp. Y1700 TaxID=3418487 RepID=UPI003B7CFE0F